MPLGIQQPRFSHAPSTAVWNAADEAIQLCAEIEMPLDEWQQIALRLMLGEEPDGTWSAQEFNIVVARQNGKNAILEARELAGLFLFDEPRIVHSAHQAATAEEAFVRMTNLIESTPWLDAKVAKVNRSPGRQRIILKTGQILSYRTRTKGGARGFSAPVVIFDEAQELTGAQIAAILPVVSTFPERQVIYTGTVLAGAVVFRGFVERVRKGIGARLGGAEWSADEELESDDVDAMRAANPSVGYRLDIPYMQGELATFRAAGEESKWREERLSIWPRAGAIGSLIGVEPWADAEKTGATLPLQLPKQHAFGIAVSPDRKHASIGIALKRSDGTTYVETIAHSGLEDVPAGIHWVIPWVTARLSVYPGAEWVIDQGGPAAPLAAGLVKAKAPVRLVDTAAWKLACAGFVDDVTGKRIQHRGQELLTTAAHGVKKHDVGEQWVYARRDSGVLVAPLEAVTLARAGLDPAPGQKSAFAFNLNDF